MDLVLSVPEQKTVPPQVEMRVKQVEAWLASLPIANSVHTAVQLYQALSALNRVELPAQNRLDLIELYCEPVAAVTSALQVHFARLALPLPPKKARLADFLRQLHGEMAHGYKLVLKQANRARAALPREAMVLAGERAIRYLSNVLLQSYQVYRPAPTNTWREIHAIYGYFERQQWQHDRVRDGIAARDDLTVEHRYKQSLLLGLSGPYQLGPYQCHQVYAFLDSWAAEARVDADTDVAERTGRFLIDLSSDVPAVPFPRDVRGTPAGGQLRVLHADRLATAIQGLITRLQRGEPPKALGLGLECIGPSCLDVLQRLMRFWGMAVRRQYSRTKREGELPVCAGLNAVHFFASGQRAFCVLNNRVDDISPKPRPMTEGVLLDLDDLDREPVLPIGFPMLQEAFRIDQWKVRDEGAGGVSLFRLGRGTTVKVGDVLGIEDTMTGQWRIGAARWLRTPDTESLEMGVEMLAPHAEPVAVAVRSKVDARHQAPRYTQALLLPALAVLRKPATLLVARGTYQLGSEMSVINDLKGESYIVHPIEVLERTGAFERLAFVRVD